MNIDKFDPTTQQLNELVAKSQEIKEVDVDDPKQVEAVKKVRIELKNARVAITKTGKEMREEALSYQKAVITKEKELIAIIEPEEERLQSIEDEAKLKKIREERAEKLPWRKQKLAEVEADVSDEALLEMDDKEFVNFLNEKSAEKLARIEAEKRAKEDEKKRAKEIEEAEERARNEAEQKAEREKKELLERIEREATEKKRKEVEEEEAKKAEEERLGRQEKYQNWLKENGYTEETKNDFIAKDLGDSVALYKLVGTYKK